MPHARWPTDPTADAGQAVEVTGDVSRFNVRAVEDRIRTPLDDGQFAAWVGQPVLIATSAMLVAP